MKRTPDMQSDANHPLPGTLRCNTCGTIGYDTDRFCACCGEALLPLCSACGSRIDHPIAFYCTQCGASVHRQQPDR